MRAWLVALAVMAAAPGLATKEAEGLNTSGAPAPNQPLATGSSVSLTPKSDRSHVVL